MHTLSIYDQQLSTIYCKVTSTVLICIVCYLHVVTVLIHIYYTVCIYLSLIMILLISTQIKCSRMNMPF